ncbi:hypothetical protein HanIR_Chr10g0454971 [Helianthus annuus]|nr:hypothetical protein HanIR_Chr10g0454971 [Helianthus annuus]
MWAALKHPLDILIGRKMNRNSDRVITLLSRQNFEIMWVFVVFRRYLGVRIEFYRRTNAGNQVPNSSIYTGKTARSRVTRGSRVAREVTFNMG